MIELDYEKCIATWDKQWNDICAYLKDNPYPFPKFEELITNKVFINVISQLCEHLEHFTVNPVAISKIFRGIKENDTSNLSESRFIPDLKFVCADIPNRMNGIDRLYNYFTIDYQDCCEDDLFYTSAHELRLDEDDLFWGCNFTIPGDFSKMKFVDLRTRGKIPKDNKSINRFLKSKATHGLKYTTKLDEDEIAYWTIQAIFSIWENSKMFAPVDNRNAETLWEQYRPFHVLCDYFERKGFDGIIYRSTVYKKGACLALFNIEHALCDYSTLQQLDSKKYMSRK